MSAPMSDDFHTRCDRLESELDSLLSPEELARIRASELKDLHGKRPFRLEREGLHFDVPTYTTFDRALEAAKGQGISTAHRNWSIVARHGRGGFDRTTLLKKADAR